MAKVWTKCYLVKYENMGICLKTISALSCCVFQHPKAGRNINHDFDGKIQPVPFRDWLNYTFLHLVFLNIIHKTEKRIRHAWVLLI